MDNSTEPMIVYSRQGCHLCEVLIEELLPLVRGVIEIQVIDIDSTTGLPKGLDLRIPVVSYAGRDICQYFLDKKAIHGILDELADAETTTSQ